MQSPGAIGVHHRKKDFYSQDAPIPSIQRFFKKGAAEVVSPVEGEGSSSSSSSTSDSDSDSDVGATQRATSPLPAQEAVLSNDHRAAGKGADLSLASSGKRERKRLSRIFSPKARTNEEQRGLEDAAAREVEAKQQPATLTAKPSRRSRRPRLVHDPVTGQKTWIRDVGGKEYSRAMRALDEVYAAQAKDGGSKRARNAIFGRSQNVMTMPFPPEAPLPAKIREIHPMVIPLFAAWGVATILGILPAVVSVGLNAWLAWWVWKAIREGAEDRRWQRERARADNARGRPTVGQEGRERDFSDGFNPDGTTEGAEWLNGIVEGLWEVMNPELFSSLGSTLEDVMQASIPGFIHAVKVVDLGQGSTPLRLTGLRILSDEDAEDLCRASQQELAKSRSSEEKVGGEEADGKDEVQRSENSAASSKDGETQARATPPKPGKAPSDEVAGTSFINVELGFIYRARPSVKDLSSKTRNAHLEIKFWIGARKVYTIPLPVWVEIKGLAGRIRARIQMTPEPPFVKNVTFTFCGLPRVGVEVVPMRINTSNLPFLSSFIQSSIDAAISEYVAPSSLTMDVGELLMGDNIKREVNALGVLVVCIHSAKGLSKQDVRGSSDPYCTLGFAGKVQYATRVALDELSPRWEERHVMTVSQEALRSRERVSITVWDADRFSSDDVIGRAEVDLVELLKRPGKLFRRSDVLIGPNQEKRNGETVEWSVGFFSKAPNTRRMTAGRGKEERPVEEAVGDEAGEQVEEGRRLSTATVTEGDTLGGIPMPHEDGRQTRNQETAVQFEPPDPSLPSGILSLQIHQIANLDCTDRSTGPLRRRRANAPGQEVDSVENEEESSSSPSPYVTIIINDETVFRSRTKALNSNPFFNAGTERFIRDWRRTLIMFVVYDFRLRENDAILGIVPINLNVTLRETSQVTQFFPLSGGVGHGRIRLSILFRPILGMSRVKEKLGWNIGTVRLLTSPVACDFVASTRFTAQDLHGTSLRARTLSGNQKVPAHRCRYTDATEREAVEWRIEENEFPFRVPARRRYAAPYMLEFRSVNALGQRRVVAMCIVWMQDLADDDVTEERLPIYRSRPGHDFHRLRQNYHHYRHEDEAEQLGVEKVGYLRVRMQFKSGLGEVHMHIEDHKDAKAVMQAWQCCVAAGTRDKKGDFAKSRLNAQGYLEQEQAEVNMGQEVSDGDSSSSSSLSSSTEDEGDPMERKTKLETVESENVARASFASSISSATTTTTTESGTSRDRHGDAEGVPPSPGLKDKVKRWREEKRELHRQHRSLKQFKAVRTAGWLGSSAKAGGEALVRKMSVQDRKCGIVETEL
ncbi:hypothetical protein ACQY0O_000971 [Thecaphora frezii]